MFMTRADTKDLQDLYSMTCHMVNSWRNGKHKYGTLKSYKQAMRDFKESLYFLWNNKQMVTKKHYEIRNTAFCLLEENFNEETAERIWNHK